MGRNVIFELDGKKQIAAPRRHGMLFDSSGGAWSNCSLLVAKFSQGRTEDDSSDGKDYFGRGASVLRGHISLPPKSLSEWKEIGLLRQIFYERAGTRAPGRFRHKFNDPKGLMVNIEAFFKKRVAETPPVLYKLGGAFRVELPKGCHIDERGIVLP